MSPWVLPIIVTYLVIAVGIFMCLAALHLPFSLLSIFLDRGGKGIEFDAAKALLISLFWPLVLLKEIVGWTFLVAIPAVLRPIMGKGEKRTW